MRRGLALGAILALAAGCVSLEPRRDTTRFWVLEPTSPPAAPDAGRAQLPVLGLGPVRLPAYLDRPELVTRAGPLRLDVSSADRWAAPLDVLFASAFAAALRAAVPAREVLAWPWPAGSAPEQWVSVDVLRFEGEADGSAVLEARWVVHRGSIVVEGVTNARERGASPATDETVAALNRTLAALARDVAAAVDTTRKEAPDAGRPGSDLGKLPMPPRL